jgi:hypothetical protein
VRKTNGIDRSSSGIGMKVLISCCLVTVLITFSLGISTAQSLEESLSTSVNSQASQETNKGEEDEYSLLNREYWKSYATNLGKAITWPLRWERSDIVRASVVLGISAGFYALDSEIQEWAQDHRSSTGDDLSDVAEKFGNAYFVIPGLGLFYTLGRVSGDEKAQETALLAFESYALANGITQGIKLMTHRHRPNTGDDFDTWDGPSFSGENTSFPSGHAASTFASVIGSEYEDNLAISVVAYSVSTLTALSRVYDNDHWMSDVFFGAAIGYGMGKLVYHERPFEKKKVFFLPSAGQNSVGLSLYWGF